MPSDTTNRGYNRPDAGVTNWDSLINDNFTDIDADVQDLFDNKASTSHDNTAHSVNYLENLEVLDGGTSVNSFTSLDFGSGLDVSDNGDGSATVSAASTVSYFHAIQASGGQTFGGSWVEINLDTQQKNTGNYTFSTGSGQVTIDSAGTYKVHYYLNINGSGSGNRSDGRAKLQEDTGSGFSDIPGSFGSYYNRAASNGQRDGTSLTVIRDFAAGDIIRMQAQRVNGSDTFNVENDGAGITIEKIE